MVRGEFIEGPTTVSPGVGGPQGLTSWCEVSSLRGSEPAGANPGDPLSHLVVRGEFIEGTMPHGVLDLECVSPRGAR